MKAIMQLFALLIIVGSIYAASACGDGVCNLSMRENCEKCPSDCKCPDGSRCEPEPGTDAVYMENQGLGCVHLAECGDGFCDFNTPAEYHTGGIVENCANCPKDCACGANWYDWGYSRYQGPPGLIRQPSPYEYCILDQSSLRYASCAAVSYCGDSKCDWENQSELVDQRCEDCPETCTSCPDDCDCEEMVGEGFVCDSTLPNANELGCGMPVICGDHRCDQKTDENGKNIGEDCKNCKEDCICDDNSTCEDTDPYGYWCINAKPGGGWAECNPATDKYCQQPCGDGFCYPMEGEDCTTCLADCACSDGMACRPDTSGQDSKGCIPASAVPSCGDRVCDESETCEACPDDCFCEGGTPETELFCSDGIDEDKDGKTDCADDDCAFNPKCVGEENKIAAQSIKDAFMDDLKSRSTDTTALETIATVYSDRPSLMMQEMNKYMVENVYFPERMDNYLKVFDGDPQNQQELRDIAANTADPFERELKLQAYIYQTCIACREQTGLIGYIGDYALNPPKWLYGGEYGAGGALDWSDFAVKNVIRLGDAVGKPVSPIIKSYAGATTVIIAVYDAKDLLDRSEVIAETNIGDREKVGLVVLDGALKITKIVDPTGYFSNLGDATVGKVIEVSKMISDRNQGYFNWKGRVLHQEADGAYVDVNSNERFVRVPGGFMTGATFVPAG